MLTDVSGFAGGYSATVSTTIAIASSRQTTPHARTQNQPSDTFIPL